MTADEVLVMYIHDYTKYHWSSLLDFLEKRPNFWDRGFILDDCDFLWVIAKHFWMVIGGCQMLLASCENFWLVVAGCGRFWLVLHFITNVALQGNWVGVYEHFFRPHSCRAILSDIFN